MRIYRGEYKDIETDLSNANAQVTKRIDILDLDTNPYGLYFTETPNGGNTDYEFFYDTIPDNTVSFLISYSNDGGSTWTALPFALIDPLTFTIPTDNYIFVFTFRRNPGPDIFYSFEDEIIDLEMTDDPVRDVVIDNDEDKFTPIRSRQLQIQIYSSNTISINTFSGGDDNRFKVNFYVDSVLKFTGFLSMGDIRQAFMPNPNVITMIAADGLGFLNDIPLTDFDGETPQNEQSILMFLLWALSKTGHELNLAAVFNIREVTASNLNNDNNGLGHFFTWCFLDAKTFEAEVGECENCYDVITKILGHEAELFQQDGEWRIQRIDEVEHGLATQTVYRWRYDGVFIEKASETFEENIGVGEDYSWMNDDAEVYNDRLIKKSTLIYKYETPKETPCNVDFERGDYVEDIDADSKKYALDCWDKYSEGVSGDDPPTADIYIRRDFVNDTEVDRCVVIEAAADWNFIMSSGVYVNIGDKFNLNLEQRMSADQGGSGSYRQNSAQLRLYGDDGTYWTHAGKTSVNDVAEWVACTSTFKTNQRYFVIEGDASEDQTDRKNLYSGEVAPIPVGGTVKLLIYANPEWGDSDDTYISGVRLEYIPLINGSYQIYSGQQWTVQQGTNTINVREEEVYISDSPNRLYKGALLIEDSPGYILAGLFYNAAQEPDGVVYAKKYGEIQAFDVWNQFNRNMKVFDGTVDHTNPYPALGTRYFLTDSSDNTLGRMFLLLHYEIDTHLCEWAAFLKEVSNENIGKTYTGETFKYITSE